MTILPTLAVLSSLSCALLVLSGACFAYGNIVLAWTLLSLGGGWLGVIQAGLLRMAARGTNTEPSSVVPAAPEVESR